MLLYDRSYTETNINLFVRFIFVLLLFKQGHVHPPSLHAIHAGAARPSCRRFELLLGPDNLRFNESEKNEGKLCTFTSTSGAFLIDFAYTVTHTQVFS